VTRLDRAAPLIARLAALLVSLVGLVDLWSALTRPDRGRVLRLEQVLSGAVTTTAAALTATVGVLLLLLARGLGRRKRRAWQGAVALLAISVVLHLGKGLDVEEAALSALLLAGLVVARGEFAAEGDPRTRWAALRVGLPLLTFDVALGSLLISVSRPRHVGVAGHAVGTVVGHREAGSVVLTALRGLIAVGGPLGLDGRRGDLLGDTLSALGALTVVVVVYLLLRPSEPAPSLSAEDEECIRGLLARHGRQDSLGYFALRPDKSVIWSPSRKACVAYRVVTGVMLASGDPLGDPEAWPGALTAFLAEAKRHGWAPAVMGCSERAGQAWTRAGLDALELGDEAVIEVADFTLEGRPMRGVRQAVTRVQRAGYVASASRLRDLDPALGDAYRLQADAWRGAETERGFSMALGRIGDPRDPDCVVVTATREGRLAAFLHFVPWGADGLSLDLMRRDREGDNGLNEFLIATALASAPALGVTRLSLNFAVFRSALARGEQLGAGPVLRIWRRLLLLASRWFQIESLYRFNAKFRPLWEPRFVCYRTARDLPRIAVAALEAEAFLVLPRPRLPRWRGRGRLPAGDLPPAEPGGELAATRLPAHAAGRRPR